MTTTTWSGCDNTMTIIPDTSTSYDMRFELGMNPKYTVYTKIVDTVWGNSEGQDPDLNLADGTVHRNPTKHMSIPWLYTIEVDAQNADNPSERAKLSILYQY